VIDSGFGIRDSGSGRFWFESRVPNPGSYGFITTLMQSSRLSLNTL
jgi:hypothetical protein